MDGTSSNTITKLLQLLDAELDIAERRVKVRKVFKASSASVQRAVNPELSTSLTRRLDLLRLADGTVSNNNSGGASGKTSVTRRSI